MDLLLVLNFSALTMNFVHHLPYHALVSCWQPIAPRLWDIKGGSWHTIALGWLGLVTASDHWAMLVLRSPIFLIHFPILSSFMELWCVVNGMQSFPSLWCCPHHIAAAAATVSSHLCAAPCTKSFHGSPFRAVDLRL